MLFSLRCRVITFCLNYVTRTSAKCASNAVLECLRLSVSVTERLSRRQRTVTESWILSVLRCDIRCIKGINHGRRGHNILLKRGPSINRAPQMVMLQRASLKCVRNFTSSTIYGRGDRPFQLFYWTVLFLWTALMNFRSCKLTNLPKQKSRPAIWQRQHLYFRVNLSWWDSTDTVNTETQIFWFGTQHFTKLPKLD